MDGYQISISKDRDSFIVMTHGLMKNMFHRFETRASATACAKKLGREIGLFAYDYTSPDRAGNAKVY